MVRTCIGLGGNLGDRLANLRSAVERIASLYPVSQVSSLYETSPVGFQDQPAFLNAVIAIDGPDDPNEMLRYLLFIERDLGRQRSFPNAPRRIDIDVLLFGETVVESDALTIPHPRMHERAFVLVPLAEIAPNEVHPVLQKTVGELSRDLGDTSADVRRVAGPEWIGPNR